MSVMLLLVRRIAAGDFSTDGKADLTVGAYGYNSNAGKFYIIISEAKVMTSDKEMESGRTRGGIKFRGNVKLK